MSGLDDRIGWGIVGTGAVARAFARGLSFAHGGSIEAVCSRSMEHAQAFARAFGGARSYDAYEQLLADPAVAVVYVATPSDRHAADAIRALDAGKAVLVEKPFARNAEEAQSVVDHARRSGRFCMEAMWMRFMPLVREARGIVESGRLGTLQALTADFATPVDYPPDSPFLDPTRGGGALLDRGVYGISLATFLLGEPDSISSQATTLRDGVDVQAFCQLRYASGAIASIWASTTTFGTNSATLHGTLGRLTLHDPFYRPHRLTVDRFEASRREPPGLAQAPGLGERLKESPLVQQAFRRLQPIARRHAVDALRPVRGNGYSFEADEVMACLRAGEKESAVMPLEESVRIVRWMDEARRQWS